MHHCRLFIYSFFLRLTILSWLKFFSWLASVVFSPCVFSQLSFYLLFLPLFPQIQFHLHESAYFPCDERRTIINLNAAELGSLTRFGSRWELWTSILKTRLCWRGTQATPTFLSMTLICRWYKEKNKHSFNTLNAKDWPPTGSANCVFIKEASGSSDSRGARLHPNASL